MSEHCISCGVEIGEANASDWREDVCNGCDPGDKRERARAFLRLAVTEGDDMGEMMEQFERFIERAEW